MLRRFKEKVKKSRLYFLYTERHIRSIERERFTKEMEEFFKDNDVADEKGLRKEYFRDMRKHMFSFNEWYSQYDLHGKTEVEKAEYISRSRAQKLYRSIIKPEWRKTFHEKDLFLRKFKDHIHRRWMMVTKSMPESDVVEMLESVECIVKPVSGSLGSGIFKVTPHDMNSKEKRASILKTIYSGDTLIEECIHGCDEIQRFHPKSLNTIRIVTIRQSAKWGGVKCFGSFIRLGRGGSVVDNAHAGGIFAHVDISSGKVDSDGLSTDGTRYIEHPDSHLTIKGFQIPKWKEIVEVCKASHEECPNFVVGWDVFVNSKGQIEFVEGNHAPDVDLMQSTIKKGIKNQFEEAVTQFKSLKPK